MTRPQTPLLAVDVIVEMGAPIRVVLVHRRNPPVGWAIPGGFVDIGETVAEAARRELREETSLQVELTELLGCYSSPARDPRGHTVSIVFIGRARGKPRAGDDAGIVELFDPATPPALVFDHAQILADYRELRASGRRPAVDR
jgi:8-oxo-dGTP diphosphatase